MELIGTRPLPDADESQEGGSGKVIFPSDHFGLLTIIGSTLETHAPAPQTATATTDSDSPPAQDEEEKAT
jgi:hypothetical protein